MRTEYINSFGKKVNKNQITNMRSYSELLIDEVSSVVKKATKYRD